MSSWMTAVGATGQYDRQDLRQIFMEFWSKPHVAGGDSMVDESRAAPRGGDMTRTEWSEK
jgi:hypothetical protein